MDKANEQKKALPWRERVRDSECFLLLYIDKEKGVNLSYSFDKCHKDIN